MADRERPVTYALPGLEASNYPPSPRLFTEADLRAAAEAWFEFADAGHVDSKEDLRSFLDGWLCEPYSNEGAPPPAPAIERAAYAMYERDARRSVGMDSASHVWPRVASEYRRQARAALNAALNMSEEQSRAYVEEAVGAC